MAEIRSAKYTTPDGVERSLRFTKASQFRMSREKQAAGSVADYFMLWAMMFDEEDDPPVFPKGHQREGQIMTANWLGANLSPLDTARVMAAISEATTGAVVEKKIVEAMENHTTQETQKLAGLIAGLSLESTSASEEAPRAPSDSSASSGGSHRKSSKRSAIGIPS